MIELEAAKTYDTISADLDLLAEAATLGISKRPARAIVVGTAGDVVVKMAAMGTNTAKIYCAAGVPVYGRFTAIVDSGTTAAKVSVLY